MKIITLFIITLSRILAILPSYVLAQCQRDVKITFYGWPDNGGNAKVSGSCGGRTKAGGIGTLEDPLTFAAAGGVFSSCEVIYVPYLKKFARFEDLCGACEDDKANSNDIRVDIFIGSNTANGGRLVQKCERTLTPGDKQTIIRKGGNAFPVDSRPLFEVPWRYPTKGTCHPGYTYSGSGPELCQTSSLDLQDFDPEHASQYPTADIGGGDDTSKPNGPSSGTDFSVAGQDDTQVPNPVTEQNLALDSDQGANQAFTLGNTQDLFASLKVNFGNWPTIATDTSPGNKVSLDSDVIPGANPYAEQNSNQAATESDKGQTARIYNQVIASTGNTYLADASQVSNQFPNLGTFNSQLNSVSDQNSNSAPASSNVNLIPNSVALGPSTNSGDTLLADRNLPSILNSVDASDSLGGNGVTDHEAVNNKYLSTQVNNP